jgi:hypothetical protein
MPTNNYRDSNLSSHQQRLINIYINQYNQTNTHIEQLLDILDEIKGNIINVVSLNQPRRIRMNRHNRNSNANINRLINQIFNETQRNHIRYDYNRPINPYIYNDYYVNTSTSNINNTTRNNDVSSFLNNFLSSRIVVRPTEEHIQNASRVIKYSDINNPISEVCPISLDTFNENDMVRQILQCGHLFKQQQFNEWFESNVKCPVCRYDIRNYSHLSRRTTNENNVSENNNSSNNNSNELPTNTRTNSSLNQNENIIFEVNNEELRHNFLDRITTNIFQSRLPPNSTNNNRFMIDPSNNILFYDTIVRPNNNQHNSNNDTNIN